MSFSILAVVAGIVDEKGSVFGFFASDAGVRQRAGGCHETTAGFVAGFSFPSLTC